MSKIKDLFRARRPKVAVTDLINKSLRIKEKERDKHHAHEKDGEEKRFALKVGCFHVIVKIARATAIHMSYNF